jgi:LysM repeat protein
LPKEKGMLKERLAGLVKYAILLSMLIPSIAFSQTQNIKEYTVMKGDTLWDISKKELNDSFLWPKVWKENPSIANPDRLYPGQTIRIPLYLMQKEKSGEQVAPKPAAVEETVTAKEEEKKEEMPAAAIEHPLVTRDLLMSSGYIADAIPSFVGKVEDSPSGRALFGDNDSVYITVDHPVQVGDKFYVIKVSGPVKHPITGRKVGYIVMVRGVLEITNIDRGDTLAKISKSFGQIDTGDLIEPYYEIEPPMTDGHFRTPDIDGVVLAGTRGGILQSMLDIIYIDRGCKDGIALGDMFMTLEVGNHAVPNGVIQVISCKDHTATALIKNNSSPITPGNIFAQLVKD